MPKIRISASIVSYGGFDDVKKCVDSLLQFTKRFEFTLFVIDNNSPDDTRARLTAEYQNTENVKLILLEKNVGFGSGHNACLPYLESDFHAVINPDIIVDSDVLASLADFLSENADVAIVTPQLKFPNGEIQYVAKRKPSFMSLLSRQLPFSFLKKYEQHYLMQDEDLTVLREVEFCSGCFFVIRTEVFKKINGFDNKYFMYVEDADITQKALQHGKACFYPKVYVFHAWNRQTKRSLKHFFMQITSMFRYFTKWGFRWGFKITGKEEKK